MSSDRSCVLSHLASWTLALTLATPLTSRAAPTDLPVPPAVQDLRRHMLDAPINSLTFHSMDQLFETREVTRSGPVWALPRHDVALNFRYTAGGASHTPEEFLDRTYTNALLILKHGTVVYENYRNLTSD